MITEDWKMEQREKNADLLWRIEDLLVKTDFNNWATKEEQRKFRKMKDGYWELKAEMVKNFKYEKKKAKA